MGRYKCLILDHDDTVVNSTPMVHYPAFMAALSAIRPDVKYTLEEFVKLNFEHGFFGLMNDVLKFSKDEFCYQEKVWREFMEMSLPCFFPMMGDIIRKFKSQGGVICVSTHSFDEYVLRDYVANCGVRPDMIFSCDLPEQYHKPSVYAVNKTMEKYGFLPEQILVVDDMPAGLKMANETGVDFAYAGWGTYLSDVLDYMCKNAKYVLTDVYELGELVL